MSLRGRGCSKMPCESCAVQFSVFRRKRSCSECERYYCAGCLRRGGGAMCAPCRALSTRPLQRLAIAHLKARDLQCFLQRQNVSTRGCVEKEELVNLCVTHVNSAAYRRHAPRDAFPTLKGLTTNINDFIASTFDLRPQPRPQPPPQARPQPPPQQARVYPGRPAPARGPGDCFNSTHAHVPRNERFSATPDGQERISVAVPAEERAPPAPGARVDTADCFEVEDLDEGWEVVGRPAAPLPTDSEELLRPEANWSPATPIRSSSSLELRSEPDSSPHADRVSLQDEPLHHRGSSPDEPRPPRTPTPESPEIVADGPDDTNDNTMETLAPREPRADGPDDINNGRSSPQQIDLDNIQDISQLDALSVRQMKQLLARNRVEFRGCVERAELLARARALWREHARYRDQIETLPLEECCKICMAAPLECVLLECGHIAACTECARQLAECPICRQYVVRAVRFFRS